MLSPEDTKAALPWGELIQALEEGFRSEVTSPLRHHHRMKNDGAEDDVILLMPAWSDGDWGGIKLVNVHPGNSKMAGRRCLRPICCSTAKPVRTNLSSTAAS